MSKCIICGKYVDKSYGNSSLYGVYCKGCAVARGLTDEQTILNLKQRITELEEQLKNAIILEPNHYVIITNGWKNKKYGIALSQQRVQCNYIQETDERMGCYVPCLEFGKFKTLEEAEQRLKEIKNE